MTEDSTDTEIVFDGTKPPTPVKATSRLTVVEQVYFRILGESPTQYETRYSIPIDSEEYPYERRLKVSETPIPLEIGGIASVSQVLIKNDFPKPAKVLSDEEKKYIASQVLDLRDTADGKPFLSVFPSESVRFTPSEGVVLFMSCRNGSTRVSLIVLPR